jgi:uncharacterized protein (TIGR04222 family)
MDVFQANLSGPMFLLAYAIFAAVAIVVARGYARGAGSSPFGPAPTPLVDVERDPFEVAYLRGGGGCMLRFALFELVRRRALRVVPAGPNKKGEALEATGFAEGPGPGTLLPAIVAFAATPRTPVAMLASSLPALATADGAAAFESRLAADGLLLSAAEKRRSWSAVGYGALALVVVAASRNGWAFSVGHHNVGFLAVETLFALAILLAVAHPQRLSARGRAYIARIRSALAPARTPPAGSLFDPQPLFVAAAGFEVLAGTEYAPLTPFVRSRSSDGSCGSGGDSGGGGGGGGCGGGCGG